ncbi:MAG: tRNA uracil 4-sulfurtransferase ThiI [bacterium]
MTNYLKKCTVIHYGEIALKGKNRSFFEGKLRRNIKKALQGIEVDDIERLRGRMLIHFSAKVQEGEVTERLKKVFGITHFSLGVAVSKDLEEIKKAAWSLLKDESFASFRIDTRRAQKEFPMTSVEVNKEVGAYIQERCGKRVDLTNPGVTCYIEVAGPYALIYCNKTAGLRGLPVGVSERGVSLLSSGIDSPVASYLMLKRGVDLIYVHFHSQPYTHKASQENTENLVAILNQYQFRSKVYFVPFIEIQKEIMAKAPSELRVLLYRRYMIRLAESIAKMEHATALITGENIGQVASQTLSNIRVVAEVTRLPIFRPLAGFDKEEIIQMAKVIGTFDISIQPYEDCCSLFVPKHPATSASPRSLAQAEKLLVVDDLMEKALEEAEVKVLSFRG